MNNTSFKNFKYALIDSVKTGYKEVLVTYSVGKQKVRQYVFIKEEAGKGKDYYLNEAKKQINERIESGAINKSTNKQLHLRGVKTGSAKKTALIAISAVLAGGAFATGGYFLGSYLGGGGGGITVVFNARDGYFGSSEKTSMVMTNVAKGTELSKITGYVEPTSNIQKQFEYWYIEEAKDVKIESNYVVTVSVYLNAWYKDTPASARAQAKVDIEDYYHKLVDYLDPTAQDTPAIVASLNKIVVAASANDSPLNTIDNVDIINNVSSLTNKTLLAILLDPAAADTIENSYKFMLDQIKQTSKTSEAKAEAISHISTIYLDIIENNPTVSDRLQGCVAALTEWILLPETLDEPVEIASSMAEGILRAASKIYTDDAYTLLVNTVKNEIPNIVKLKDKCPNDKDLVDVLSEMTSDYCQLIVRTDFSPDWRDAIKNLYETVRQNYLDISTSAKDGKKTYYQETLVNLNKLALDVLATTNSPIGLPYACTKLTSSINEFKGTCEYAKVIEPEDSEKIAEIYSIYASLFTSIAENTPADSQKQSQIDNFITLVTDTLTKEFIDSKYDKLYKDFTNIVLNASNNISYVKSLDDLINSVGDGKGAGALKDLKDAMNVSADSAAAINILNEGYIKASCLSDTSNLATIKKWYEDVKEEILSDKAGIEKEARAVSKIYAKIADWNLKYSRSAFNFDQSKLSKFKIIFDNFDGAAKASFLDEFNNSDVLGSLSIFYSQESEFFKYFDMITHMMDEYPSNPVAVNSLKTWFLLYNSNEHDYLNCVGFDGNRDINKTIERFKMLIDDGSFATHADFGSYDLIYNVWKDFFKSVDKTTNINTVKTLKDAAKAKIEEIVNPETI